MGFGALCMWLTSGQGLAKFSNLWPEISVIWGPLYAPLYAPQSRGGIYATELLQGKVNVD